MKDKYIYVNMILFTNGRKPDWYPCWDSKFLASTSRNEAVKLRKKFVDGLPPSIWKKEQFRTIRLEVY